MKLIGIKATKMTSGKSEGKTAYTYFLTSPYTDYEIQTSECCGLKTTSEFSYTKFDVAVGDEVTPVYEKGFQDRAVLVNLVPFPKEKGK